MGFSRSAAKLCRIHSSKPEIEMGLCGPLDSSTRRCHPRHRQGALLLAVWELSSLSAGESSLPAAELQACRDPVQNPVAVCIFPQEVFKTLLAKPRPSGQAPVPPGIFRDQPQFTILASYSDLLATCSQTVKLCNLSWRILCLWRSFVHSASFPEGLLYSRY